MANGVIIGPLSERVTRPKGAVFAFLFFGSTFTVIGGLGDGTTATASSQSGQVPRSEGQVQTAHLEYTELGYSFTGWDLPFETQSAPFRKEPVFGRDEVIRGIFKFGGIASNSIAFAWDRTAGKLYLDLNRNLDMTDDPAGVFASQKGYPSSYQSFTNVHLPVNTLSGKRQVLVDLSLWSFGKQFSCNAAVHSCWQGKVTLQNKDWQVGIVENSFGKIGSPEGGHLLLRPWEARNEPFRTYAGSMDTFPFSRKLFVHDHAYQLDFTSESTPTQVSGSTGNNSKLSLQFSEQHPALGELKITGSFVQRLILEGGPYLIVIDKPRAERDKPEAGVRIPVGSYFPPKVWLKNGNAEAYHETRPQETGRKITIEEKKPAVLAAGGPLTNSVLVTQSGARLQLTHQLVGAGGEVYTRTYQDRSNPPTFAVYRSGKKIGSGKFEFG